MGSLQDMLLSQCTPLLRLLRATLLACFRCLGTRLAFDALLVRCSLREMHLGAFVAQPVKAGFLVHRSSRAVRLVSQNVQVPWVGSGSHPPGPRVTGDWAQAAIRAASLQKVRAVPAGQICLVPTCQQRKRFIPISQLQQILLIRCSQKLGSLNATYTLLAKHSHSQKAGA